MQVLGCCRSRWRQTRVSAGGGHLVQVVILLIFKQGLALAAAPSAVAVPGEMQPETCSSEKPEQTEVQDFYIGLPSSPAHLKCI